MKKILVTGANGQLGKCLRKIAGEYADKFQFEFADSQTIDITDSGAVMDFFEDYQPHYCINAAAYTAVDLAETETEKAFAVNAYGVANLAEACAETKSILIHVSTDYVFDGDTNIPYGEDDFTDPKGIYGASKRKGEELALEINPGTVVLRTSWLYSEYNKNFVKTMLNLFSTREELNIVADQYGQPTNANDLAAAIMTVIKKEPKTFGIFHFSNYPETTWFHFAEKIAEFSGSGIKLNPISTHQYPTPASRPARSTMCLDKIEHAYGIEPSHWENSLKDCITILTENA